MQQIELFSLPAQLPARRAICRARGRLLVVAGVQLCLDFTFVAASNDDEVDGEDDPLIAAPIIHRLVSAAEAAPLALSGPRSVFDMAGLSMNAAKRRAPERVTVITRVERLDGVVRCIRILPQETPEWQIKEAARRARQTPPKPTKGAKTMSSKMAAMIEPVSECHAARASVALTKQAEPSKAEQARAERERMPANARKSQEKENQ